MATLLPAPQGDWLCLSDLHLSPGTPQHTALFLQCCREIPASVSDIYILGDLFDFWVHRQQAQEESQRQVLSALTALVREGRQVWVMGGNRDFALDANTLAQFSLRSLPDPAVLPTGILLTHGDLLCTDDTRYLHFRRWIRNPLLLAGLRWLPYPSLLWLGRRLRRQSQQELQQKPREMTQASPLGIHQALLGEGIFASSLAPYHTLIHGHTHLALDEHIADLSARRLVLSDWHEDGATLLIGKRDGDIQLWHFPA